MTRNFRRPPCTIPSTFINFIFRFLRIFGNLLKDWIIQFFSNLLKLLVMQIISVLLMILNCC